MIALPTIIDLGSDEDAGRWLEAMPFARFPVSEFAHDAGAQSTEALSFTLVPSVHATGVAR